MGSVMRTRYGCVKRVQLTDAEIKNLPLVALELLPARSRFIWQPVSLAIELSPWVADYTNIDACADMFVSSIAQDWDSNPVFPADVLADGEAAFESAQCQQFDGVFDFVGTVADFAHTALNLVTANGVLGAFTGGNPANVLTVTLCYNVLEAKQ